MTIFLSFRTRDVGGAVCDPILLYGDGAGDPDALTIVPDTDIATLFTGRDLLFAVHGFNVSKADGVFALGGLDSYLALVSPSLMIGILWPGDAWIPVLDYPFEGSVGVDCGNRLAKFCNVQCRAARSLAFVSHSLGARLVLQAVAQLQQPARSVCLTAGAINNRCLTEEYAQAAKNTQQMSLLASRRDDVLKLAFTVGDPFADLLHDDHTPFEAALGAQGPPPPPPSPVQYPWQIPDGADYGHGDYLPSRTARSPHKWPRAADFMKRAFLGQTQIWPEI